MYINLPNNKTEFLTLEEPRLVAEYTPICFNNPDFLFCFDDLASIAKNYGIPLWL
jgi:hypothetical protein